MTPQEMQSALEAIIYASDEPATIGQLSEAVGGDKVEVRAALDFLVAAYQTDDRGIEIRKVAGGWKLYTKPQHHDVVRKFIKSLRPPVRLTMPALETLAVVAYKQPVTAPEINEIRGVNCGGVLKTLLEKRLITTAGRKAVIGRPILYRSSKDFLMRFGLSDLEELPSFLLSPDLHILILRKCRTFVEIGSRLKARTESLWILNPPTSSPKTILHGVTPSMKETSM